MGSANCGFVPDKFQRGEKMSLYNPAADPSVINGIQEAYGFKIGDLVEYTNPNGAVFAPHIVVGFVQNPDPSFLPENTVYINSDSPWYPVKPSSLRKIVACEECVPCEGTRTKQDQELNYPKRGGACNYTMDCMWGVDGWCDRPRGSKCELEKADEE